jgi:hypothetical protein
VAMTDTPPTPTSRRYPGLRPFQKGVSGNPKGRPPVARDIRELARQHGPAVFARLLHLALSRSDAVAVRAGTVILAYGYGPPMQSVDILAPAAGPAPHASPTEIRAAIAEIQAQSPVLVEEWKRRMGNGHATAAP